MIWTRVFATVTAIAAAQVDSAASNSLPSPWESMDARESVRWGNEKLRAGEADAAIEAYRHAEQLAPNETRIPYVEGLGHFTNQDYQAARTAFEQAALSHEPTIADNATYSLGTCDHAEALAAGGDPNAALEKLEDAIQRYQDVLANQPDHVAARDAFRKAAAKRRLIKQQMQQQQQQQNQDGDSSEQNESEQEPNENQSNDSSQQQDQQEPFTEQENPQSNEQQSQSSQQGEQQEQEATPEQSQAEEETSEAGKAESKQDLPKEQAERRLREMMQAMRQQQKQRRKAMENVRVVPVDKDW